MDQRMRLLVFPVKDIDKAKKLYAELLGVEPYVDSPYYVGFRSGDLEFGLDPNGKSGGPLPYWDVEDINATLKQLLDAGAEADQDVKNVVGGLLTATVKDADGNTIGLRQSP